MSLGGLERDSGRAVGGRVLFKEINDKTIDGLTGTDSLWQVRGRYETWGQKGRGGTYRAKIVQKEGRREGRMSK